MEQLETFVVESPDAVGAKTMKDPPSVAPPRIKKEIEEQIPDIIDCLHPLPVALQMNGARVKLPYEEYHERIENIRFVEGVTMKEVARVLPSKMRNFILIKALPKSETGYVI